MILFISTVKHTVTSGIMRVTFLVMIVCFCIMFVTAQNRYDGAGSKCDNAKKCMLKFIYINIIIYIYI